MDRLGAVWKQVSFERLVAIDYRYLLPIPEGMIATVYVGDLYWDEDGGGKRTIKADDCDCGGRIEGQQGLDCVENVMGSTH